MIKKISDKEYFACDGVNASALKYLDMSPAHYKAYIDKLNEEKNTESLRLGSQIHKYILEDVDLNIKPNCDRRTKEGKELFKTFQDSIKYSTDYVSLDEYEKIKKMKEVVKDHPVAKILLDPVQNEKAAFVQCPQTGLKLKCKYDCLPNTGNCIFDLKTTDNADPFKLKYTINKYKYHIQACHYLYVAELLNLNKDFFVFIFIEKDAPFAISCVKIDKESIQFCMNQYYNLLEKLAKCKANNDYSESYPNEIIDIIL